MSQKTTEATTTPRIAVIARFPLASEQRHTPDTKPPQKGSNQALSALVVGCLTLGVFPSSASAQTIPFDDLARTLKIGQEVRVKDSDGERTGGKIVAIAESGILIARRRFPRRSDEVAFTKDVVRSIDVVDSIWAPGGYIGAAVGVGIAAAYLSSGSSNEGGLEMLYREYLMFGVLPVSSLVVGLLIDGLTNKSYVVATQTPQVTVAPVLGRERKGIVVGLRF